MRDTDRNELVVEGSAMTELEVVVSYEERPIQARSEGVIFTAVSTNHYTGSQQSSDTCCTCTN